MFGHSADESELQTLFVHAKNWIAKQGSQWLEQFKKSKIKKRMKHKVTITNLKEESRINSGVPDIFGKLYNEIGFCERGFSIFQLE